MLVVCRSKIWKKILKEKVVTRFEDHGIKYKLYVPENVNTDTPIFVYAYGSGDPNMEKCIGKGHGESVVKYSAYVEGIKVSSINV